MSDNLEHGQETLTIQYVSTFNSLQQSTCNSPQWWQSVHSYLSMSFPDLIPDYFQPWSEPLLISRNKVLITHMVISLSPPYHYIPTIPCFSATKFAALWNVLLLLHFYILCRIFLQERTRCRNIWTFCIPFFMSRTKQTMFDGVALTSMSAWTGKCPTLKTTSNKARSLHSRHCIFGQYMLNNNHLHRHGCALLNNCIEKIDTCWCSYYLSCC